MKTCSICAGRIDGVPVTDAASGVQANAACVAQRVVPDAAVTVLATVALVLAPTILLWAA